MLRSSLIGAFVLFLGSLGLLGFDGWVEHRRSSVGEASGLAITAGSPLGRGFDPRIGGTEPQSWQALVALRGIQLASRQYPPKLLQVHAPNVLIAGRLELMGTRIGGTVQPDWVLIASDFIGPGNGARAVAAIFHHEVSSLFLQAVPFPDEKWRALYPDDVTFPEDDAGRLAATQVFASDLSQYYAQGFVSDYGASSVENDINTYAEMLMSDPERLIALAKDHPRIAAKARLLHGYYVSLDPGFANMLPALDP